jgi:hypothetical protein
MADPWQSISRRRAPEKARDIFRRELDTQRMREGIAAEQPQVGVEIVSCRREDKDLNSACLDAPTQRLGCMAST